ncbi:MAG TPA: heavy metal-binding domain-containing protein, partial [Candidatus Acidoferrales bacterium]|nr:heavy metal-binding domain-containing protein [Candidatus Acidoferrales bacterium]
MTASNPAAAPERDPVCGMNVNPATAKHIHEHGGKIYYFCCGSCAEKFKANPAAFLNKTPAPGLVTLGMPAKAASSAGSHAHGGLTSIGATASSPKAAPAAKGAPAYVCPMCPEVRETKPGACPSCGMALEAEVPVAATRTEYTCPMHPEVVRAEPGSCPICGMALEPRTVAAVAEENPELRDMTRRFWVGLVLTVPLLGIAMGNMLWPEVFMRLMGGIAITRGGHVVPLSAIATWVEFLLATPVVLWCGLPFFRRFWASLVNRSPNMFTLIGLGTGVSYVYSVIATVAPQLFPPSLRSMPHYLGVASGSAVPTNTMSGYPDVYFEAAAAITTL